MNLQINRQMHFLINRLIQIDEFIDKQIDEFIYELKDKQINEFIDKQIDELKINR